MAATAVLAVVLAGCGSSGSSGSSSSSAATGTSTSAASSSSAATTPASSGAATGDAATATSLADFGDMAGLEAAALAEGKLNVIALPPDWANYGEVIAAFQAKYPGITIDQQNPDGSSAEEIAAADTNKGTDVAPDVFDLGTSVALSSTAYFAPYKVAAWDDIDADKKESTGLWVNDYTGTMVIGYDSTQFGDITNIDDLLDPKFAGVVALNGNPTEAGAAFNGVVMAALAKGGSLDDISAGVTFFKAVKDAGNLYTGNPTKATVTNGETPVLFDWSYNQVGYKNDLEKEGVDWKLFVPEGANIGSYYNQAINKDAPHPAAARLWEEFLYSAEAQNLWLKGGANPVLQEKMVADGTINQEYLDVLGSSAAPEIQTADQVTKAQDYLKANWSTVTG